MATTGQMEAGTVGPSVTFTTTEIMDIKVTAHLDGVGWNGANSILYRALQIDGSDFGHWAAPGRGVDSVWGDAHNPVGDVTTYKLNLPVGKHTVSITSGFQVRVTGPELEHYIIVERIG